MGIIAGMLAGAAEGAGNAGVKVGLNEQEAAIQAERDARLKENAIALQHSAEDIRQAGRTADIEQDTSPAVVAKKAAAASGLITGTTAARVADTAAVSAQNAKDELARFQLLEPAKRKAVVDDAVAKLTALSTPDMLAAARKIALSTHIVDPSYTLIPNADGTVTTFDSKSGKSGGVLKDSAGEPVIRKDPEELKAAASVINMANTNLRIAQAEHKATINDINTDQQSKAAADEAWKAAQADARRVSAPALAILYGKAGIKTPATPGSKSVSEPPQSAIDYLRKKPDLAPWFKEQFGVDPQKYLAEKPQATQSEDPAKSATAGAESPRAKYMKALKELNDMKGGLLPTPEGNKDAIKAKEQEVNRLLQATY